jgi:hypothetical protein
MTILKDTIVKVLRELPDGETHKKIIGGKKTRGIHRVYSNWQKLLGIGNKHFNTLFESSNAKDYQISLTKTEPVIVIHDFELYVVLKKQGYNVVGFLHTDTEVLDKIYQNRVNCIHFKEGGGMIGYKNSQPIDWSKATAMGNLAFSITNELLPSILAQKPKQIKLIIQSSFTTAITGVNGHQKWALIRESLLNSFLKKIVFLPAKWFEQVDVTGKIKQAEINAVLFECDQGYNGPIDIECYQTQQIYTAPRSSKWFPRTRDAYKMLHCYPKMFNHETYYFGADGGRVENQKLISNGYYVAIPHAGDRQAKQKQKTGRWADNNATPILQFARTINTLPSMAATEQQLRTHEPAHQGDRCGTYDHYVHSFATALERDSFLSLCHSYYFYTTFTDFVFKLSRYSTPAVTQIPNFPLDRIWDDQQIKKWVNDEAKKQNIKI